MREDSDIDLLVVKRTSERPVDRRARARLLVRTEFPVDVIVYTPEEFAERAAVSLKYVQRVEAGRANLTIRSLVRVARLLGVAPSDLLMRPRRRAVRRGRPPSL